MTAGHQPIIVVSTTAGDDDVRRLRASLGRGPLVLCAPTAEARRLVTALGVEPRPEVLLAPVRFPEADRGHHLDALVRRNALQDRYRDVVVLADPATVTLLVRALAPDQLPSRGAVTTVLLPRGDRPVPVRQAIVGGIGLGLLTGMVSAAVVVVLAAVASAGLALLLVGRWRHVGRALLLAAGVAVVVVFLTVAGSARFPGAW